MATNTDSASILLVSKNPSVIESTRANLAEEGRLDLINKSVNSDNIFPLIAEMKPDVILLDFEFQHNPFYLVDKIASKYPASAIVAILSESEMINVDRVVLSGARAFIQYPYRSNNLVVTIRRVLELLKRNQSNPAKTAEQSTSTEENEAKLVKTYTVFSPKGGAGTTTIATNLAISLHETLKEDVLLVDGKHLFGHVALYLNLRTGNSITDLIAHAGNLDERLIKQVVVKHTSGIHVLPSPNNIGDAQGIRPDNLFPVIQNVQQVFPNIIIDAGNSLNENAVTYMDSSDRILMPLNPDLASMRDARLFMDISSTLSYPKDKILLLLNLTGRKGNVKSQEIENILKMEIFGDIPSDENLALSCVNEGVPFVLKKPRHRISKSFSNIAKNLVKNIRTAESG